MEQVVGICLPSRPRVGEPGWEDPQRWGCLRVELQGSIKEELRARSRWPIEWIDVRQAHVESGEVIWRGRALSEQIDALFWYCEIDRAPGGYALEVLKTLAAQIPVEPDPWRWERAVDKYSAHLALRRAKLAVPEFVLCDHRRLEVMRETLERWGAAVLKPRRGAWGKGVTLIEDWPTLRDMADYLRASQGSQWGPSYFLERYYANDVERWASLTVLGGELMYGYRKRASKQVRFGARPERVKILDAGERGGDVDLCEVSAQQRSIAQRASRCLGLPVVGFDMIWTSEGPIIVDENTSPGNYEDLYEQVGLDPAGEWSRTILESLGDALEGRRGSGEERARVRGEQ